MSHSPDSTMGVLEEYGFDEWFQEQGKPFIRDGFPIARVTQVNRGAYKVFDGQEESVARLPGKFVFGSERRTDYPTVGDWVVMQPAEGRADTTIHDLLPRKSLLRREDPAKTIGFQLIAANVDHAFIMHSVNLHFDVSRLERYLVMINESKIQPIVVLTKTDLLSPGERSKIDRKVDCLRSRYRVLSMSSVTGEGMDALQDELKARQTYCLLGASGVGKTTLLNTLIGEPMFVVKEVREKDSKGRHATTRRQLIRLESGPIFIDTPGMRELGNLGIETGLEKTFDEITSHSSGCHFSDCTHMHEKGCAVIAAVESGEIARERYQSFIEIQKDSASYGMSYVDKYKKGKSTGKERRGHLKRKKK
ncbi:MAG: ribosome small subunit-dependent GTPase A [Victivallales bacterium]|nr:ribosome small subunit-dependent GTPase A [Victivallales bacterium]